MLSRTLLILLFAVTVRAADRVEPNELRYDGSFFLPAWRKNPDGTAAPRWGYGVRAMAYDAAADALVGSSHVYWLMLSRSSIPEFGGRGIELHPFVDPRGELVELDTFKKTPNLDRIGGVTIVDGRVWMSFHTYYAVGSFADLDKPTFISTSLELDDRRGPYKPGPYGDPVYGQKRTSGYLFTIPKPWADRHVGGKRLGAGKGDGAGSAGNSHGPAIYAVSTEPNADGELDALVLSHYVDGDQVAGWSACDQWEGASWVRGSVIVSGRRGRGPDCYGTPAECNDACGGGKGYHCQPYGAELLFIDVDDLARVAAGELPATAVRPYAVLDITPRLKATCSFELGAMAFDTRRSRLYLAQSDGENPIVHVWTVEAPASPPPPKPKPFSIAIRVGDGAPIEFTGSSSVVAAGRAIEYLGKLIQD